MCAMKQLHSHAIRVKPRQKVHRKPHRPTNRLGLSPPEQSPYRRGPSPGNPFYLPVIEHLGYRSSDSEAPPRFDHGPDSPRLIRRFPALGLSAHASSDASVSSFTRSQSPRLARISIARVAETKANDPLSKARRWKLQQEAEIPSTTSAESSATSPAVEITISMLEEQYALDLDTLNKLKRQDSAL